MKKKLVFATNNAHKLEEIRALFAIGHVSDEFAAKYGRAYNEDDVQQCYRGFQAAL